MDPQKACRMWIMSMARALLSAMPKNYVEITRPAKPTFGTPPIAEATRRVQLLLKLKS
jgi:hypothetical protein